MLEMTSLVITAAGIVISLFVGLFVFSQNTRGLLHRLFLLMSICVGLLTIANYFSLYGSHGDVRMWSIRLVMMMASMLVMVVYVLFRYIRSQHPALMLHEKILLIVTIILIGLHCTNFFITGVRSGVDVIQPIPGPGIIIFFAHFVCLLLLCLWRLAHEYAESDGAKRKQVRTLIIGIIPAVILAPVTSIILPMVFEQTRLVPLSPLYIIFFLLSVAYAVLRHGLFDVRLAAKRTAGYVLSIGAMAGLYILLAQLISWIFFRGVMSNGVGLSPINIFLALLLAFIFQPIKHFFDQLTNKLFYHGEYDSETFFREFGRILFFDTDLQLLLKQASVYLATNLKAERVFFYITDRGVYGRSGTQKLRMPADDIGHIAKYYRLHHESPEVIVTDAVKGEELRRILLSHQVQITLPLMLQNQAIGYLFLGDHKSHGYTARDLRTLESVANELTIAVQNSLSVEEVRELNETLQHRVEDATRELRESNRQLQRLDEAKNEFISMASHQLRTPLTSIKGYLDMLLEGDLGRVTATQRSVLSEAFLSSERMVGLINDFLNVSRIQTGKFILELRDSDLSGLVHEQVQGLEVMAKQHELAFTQHIAKDVPHTAVDIDKIRHVVMNMLDNAIYYSKPGSTIEVSLTKKQSDIFFKVKDTGIGVPKQEQSQLFGKFFRASNARKKRPDGTGVGLFLAKKVIAAHGGEIIFESVEGQGSTFGFRLPIRDAQPDT